MRLKQSRWTGEGGWEPALCVEAPRGPDLILVFGATAALKPNGPWRTVRETFPDAALVGCSTAGEIMGTHIYDDSLVATQVTFEQTRVTTASVAVGEFANSFEVGLRLGSLLDTAGLVHVFVLSDGLTVNGSELLRGLAGNLPASVAMTGGLAGDADRFVETLVVHNDVCMPGTVVAVGFYGETLRVGYGSRGGWDAFGPERLITSSKGNVLYELDGRSALDLYKQYLGKHAAGLPATGLLFPLSLRLEDEDQRLVRTILAVDEQAGSLTFAGDVPEGAYGQLMKANFDRLVQGAMDAASIGAHTGAAAPDLVICISCVGRRMILQQMAEEEVEGVQKIFGPSATLAGFYSYGEIAPFQQSGRCELHNQTMTITTFSEP